MKVDANIEQLKSDLKGTIQATRSCREVDRKKSVFVAVYMGVVSAVTTICIGIISFLPIDGIYSNFFGILSLFTSASLTVVAAWDGIFHHKKMWIYSAKTLNEFYELDADIRHVESGVKGISQVQTNEFYEQYKKIMNKSNERWYKLRE